MKFPSGTGGTLHSSTLGHSTALPEERASGVLRQPEEQSIAHLSDIEEEVEEDELVEFGGKGSLASAETAMTGASEQENTLGAYIYFDNYFITILFRVYIALNYPETLSNSLFV